MICWQLLDGKENIISSSIWYAWETSLCSVHAGRPVQIAWHVCIECAGVVLPFIVELADGRSSVFNCCLLGLSWNNVHSGIEASLACMITCSILMVCRAESLYYITNFGPIQTCFSCSCSNRRQRSSWVAYKIVLPPFQITRRGFSSN